MGAIPPTRIFVPRLEFRQWVNERNYIHGRFPIPTQFRHFSNSTNGKTHAVMVPAGSAVTVTSGPFDGIRLVDVEWEGQTLMMFTADLQGHGHKLPA